MLHENQPMQKRIREHEIGQRVTEEPLQPGRPKIMTEDTPAGGAAPLMLLGTLVERVSGEEASPSISKVLERAAIAGTDEIVAGLEKHGFEISPLLREKAEKGERF